MLVYAGIDEAGYGPLLGPLCVAATVFVLPDADPAAGAPNLWSSLKTSVCRGRTDRRKRIAVDDSKKLKGANGSFATHPLKHLERGVLSFLATSAELPAEDVDCFARLGVHVPRLPWYSTVTPLPVAQPLGELSIAAARLRRNLAKACVSCPLIACEAIDVEAFNDGVERAGVKSSVNLAAALRLVERIWRAWPHDHPRIVLDRHGGRTHYLGDLRRAWPDTQLQVLAEDEAISRYRIQRGDARVTVSFLPESERRHLPVALASMTAKYVRELLMLRLNRFFTGHLPELKPTAGYFQDGRRYLEEIEPVLVELGIQRRRLVRQV